MNQVYDIITDRIIQKLEAGEIPWTKPWNHAGAPANYVSKKPYRGINVFLLGMSGHASPYWLSFKQAQQLGGSVRKGEKGTPCIFWRLWKPGQDPHAQPGEVTDDKIPLLRYYTVFNSCQCDGLNIPAPEARPEINPIEAAEAIKANMPKPPAFTICGQACYSVISDTVGMPAQELFKNDSSYYATLFHEIGHSTRHESRLNRKDPKEKGNSFRRFGSDEYAREELVAEMTSAFLCSESGIIEPQLENAAAYIQNWLEVFRKDKKILVVAAAQAQRAADYILNRTHTEKTEETAA